tara:strand:+ start:4723 stop:5079 length:357 start_codon:yes stop_codon:yes gene_type:complete
MKSTKLTEMINAADKGLGEFDNDTFKGAYIFRSADTNHGLKVMAWDAEEGLGLARSERTGYSVAFRITGDAKPLLKRNLRPELDIETLKIETLCDGDGVIFAGIGDRTDRLGIWRAIG